ncbi:MAG: radical iron-sulfur cluster-binding oxidoreductase, partial [Candidatus Aminicenantes bacterium]|nr:radical iron-sulfur cluster-binding oxidoreductase [Candidatus Aminicenantes bacterium]
MPARDLTRQYRKGYHDQNGTRNALVLTSRGCPFRCNFCACWKLLGGKYLVRSPESVVQEMTALPEDIEQIFFADDNTLHNVQHAWRLARLIRESGIRLKFSMFARADTVVKHPDLIRYLKECGL